MRTLAPKSKAVMAAIAPAPPYPTTMTSAVWDQLDGTGVGCASDALAAIAFEGAVTGPPETLGMKPFAPAAAPSTAAPAANVPTNCRRERFLLVIDSSVISDSCELLVSHYI